MLRLLLISACIALPALASIQFGKSAASFVGFMVSLPIAVAWRRVEPQLELDWAPDQARLPVARFEGDRVSISNVRNARYRSTRDFDVFWETRTYDTSDVRTVDYVVEPFGVVHGLAHTFVSFGFADGRYLSVSVEIRRERPEIFGPLKGLFRQYELMYVVGDERDLIGMRANVRRDAVYVYPIRATRAQVKAMLESMLQRANELAAEPEFYNTLLNNCATNVLDHVNELAPEPLRYSLRVAVPGFSARYAYQRGFIDTELSFRDARRRYRINERSAFDDKSDELLESEGQTWSSRIRAARDYSNREKSGARFSAKA